VFDIPQTEREPLPDLDVTVGIISEEEWIHGESRRSVSSRV